MPFIPHTDKEIRHMLETIGADSIEDLFDEVPGNLRCGRLDKIPEGMTEFEIGQLMKKRAAEDAGATCFIGAGAYEHHIPAAVWEITTRGEFYSAYTPYQAEASQGTLQLLYEYQTMMARLTDMDVSNASLYDGASGLAEAVLMAVRLNRKSKSKRILMPSTVHPVYRQVVETIVRNQGLEIVTLPYDADGGNIPVATLAEYTGEDIAALVIPQPNFFGVLEDVDALTNWASANKAISIALVNPMALAILKPPGQWGDDGADIAVGEGQPLGAPLASGGPYFGFMCTKQSHVRQMPGRIVGATVDLDGKRGYTLTLQAREQHIRRSKATSNICTNQGLLVTAATIYMSIVGGEGLARTASACHAQTSKLADKLAALDGVELVFNRAYFHEVVVRLDIPLYSALRSLATHNILGGYRLARHYPELGEALLVCATEVRTDEEIEHFVTTLQAVISKQRNAGSPVKPKME